MHPLYSRMRHNYGRPWQRFGENARSWSMNRIRMKKITNLVVALMVMAACSSEEVNPTNDQVPLRVSVKVQVGNILYENTEASVVVRAFDENNLEVWQKAFSYEGPDNTVNVPTGYHHYAVETTKWGIQDSQQLTGTDLMNARADGNSPVTYVLSGTVPLRRLTYSLEYMGAPGFMALSNKEVYNYHDDGRVDTRSRYIYDSQNQVFILERTTKFIGEKPAPDVINEYDADGDLIRETSYTYGLDEAAVRIVDNNINAGVTGTMLLSYDNDGKRTASYSFSNGGSFAYEFVYSYKNIVSDKTTRGSTLCNEGHYLYDHGINPFRQIGYLDFTLNNLSANNKVEESIDYLACSQPGVVPSHYTYEYNEGGYPTVKTTHFAGTDKVLQVRYFYEE